jgi:hypothetical protein
MSKRNVTDATAVNYTGAVGEIFLPKRCRSRVDIDPARRP